MGDGLVEVFLALAKSGDDGEHSGEAHVTLSPAEGRRSSFEKLEPNP
jgi:hypothetical protein